MNIDVDISDDYMTITGGKIKGALLILIMIIALLWQLLWQLSGHPIKSY